MDYSKQWFERLFKENYPLMYRMAFSMVENADDAKDAVNQVFTQMWKGKPKVSDSQLRGYLLAATRNQRLSQESEEMQQQVKEQIATQLSEESMRMIGLMPRWMPGKMNGKSCNVRYSMPILFP